jgi:hypothetical protein
MSVVAGAHATLANGRPAMALPVPVFHRRDRASFAWRTGNLGHAASPRFPSPLIELYEPISCIKCGGPHLVRNVASTFMWRPAPWVPSSAENRALNAT